MDITPIFNQVLAKHNAPPIKPFEFRELLMNAMEHGAHLDPDQKVMASALHPTRAVDDSRSDCSTA